MSVIFKNIFLKQRFPFFKFYLFYFILIMFLPAAICFNSASAAGNYKLHAVTDKTGVTEGERFTLTVTISSDSNIENPLKEPDLKNFMIDARQQFNRVFITNGVQQVEAGYHYSLRPLKPGKFTIGPFELNYIDPAGASQTARSEPITIEVMPEKTEEENSSAETAPETTPITMTDKETKIISNHLITITVIILIAFLLIWFVIWQNAKKEKKSAQRTLNSDKLQISNLAADSNPALGSSAGSRTILEIKNDEYEPKNVSNPDHEFKKIISFKNAGDYKQMFVHVPKFIKQCAGAKDKDNGCFCELTNQEFIKQLNKIPSFMPYALKISEILSLCDMVNYARYSPSFEEIETTIEKLNDISRSLERGGKR